MLDQLVRRTRRFPWITFCVCASACAAYAALWIHNVSSYPPLEPSRALDVVRLGGRSTPLVADAGESWRLLSCHFVHTSGWHLGFNLAFLFTVGGALEFACRRADYVALLLACSLAAGLASMLGTPQVSAGSSGIVFGLLGSATSFGVRHHERLGLAARRYFGIWVLPFAVILYSISARNPAVDHASHLGGALAGMLCGFALPLQGSYVHARRRLVTMLTIAFVVLAAAPKLASGRTQRVWLSSGASLEIPGHWTADVGGHMFSTANGLVRLSALTVPAAFAHEPRRWYERFGRRAAAREPNSLRTSSRARSDIELSSTVHFFPRPGPHTTVLVFETPAAWRTKYRETHEAVLRSLRTRAHAGTAQPLSPTQR